jgi:hypothetical protein
MMLLIASYRKYLERARFTRHPGSMGEVFDMSASAQWRDGDPPVAS